MSALDEHPAWPRLTDAQREDARQVWEEIVTPALQDAQAARRDAERVLIAAQDHRDAVSMFVRDATFAAARMPGHDDAYGCCTHGPSVGRVCGCRTRGAAFDDELPAERCGACGLVSRGLVDGVCADCRDRRKAEAA